MTGVVKRKLPIVKAIRNDDELDGEEYLKPRIDPGKRKVELEGDAEEGDLALKDIVDEDQEEETAMQESAKPVQKKKEKETQKQSKVTQKRNQIENSTTLLMTEAQTSVNLKKRKKLEKLKEKKKKAKLEQNQQQLEIEPKEDAPTITVKQQPLLTESSKTEVSSSVLAKIGNGLRDHASFVNDRMKKFFSKQLSEIELSDLQLDESHFVQLEDTLAKSIKSKFIDWKKRFNSETSRPNEANDAEGYRGAPVVVIITHSAIRAVDIYKSLGEFTTIGQVAKLFAKHIKLQEHVEMLQNKIIKIAVGTPNRILKLAEMGELRFTCAQYVILDGHLDAKSFSVFDIADTKKDLLTLLQQFVIPMVLQSKTKIGISRS
eukprot:TRINITY_DN9368_c0_g1_i1.p1 TRINITY_DN9368_c0_g1~~TRINITY_DN9368_c0_g1_i1.p1  ORF type:complete len:375 (-),score=108.36 TRINITY_DN9368_c0_g1_i1:69-1193(-)